ncbi:MAG: hypothetical protein R3C59_27540 [Planctomycetaceae bacterium]
MLFNTAEDLPFEEESAFQGRRLRFTLLGDGSSDEALIRHLDRLIRRHVANDVAVESNWADLRGLLNRPTSLKARLVAALDYFRVTSCLKNEAKGKPQKRIQRPQSGIKAAWNEAACSVESRLFLVRMSEAWLLTEEMAIRKA